MAANSSSDHQNGCQQGFEAWLSSRMTELGLDEEVFGSYVKGILDSEDSNEEDFKDALIGILEGMTDYPLEEVCNEILEKWKASRLEVVKKHKIVKEIKAEQKKNKLAEIMEKQASTVCTTKPGQLRSDNEMKKLLVAQYGHELDKDPCSESDHEESCAGEKSSEIIKNVNAQSVADREKEKRDKMREENDQRKQQIKEAKEKQKQKAEERKDKEKKRTQKGERRTR